ncbi:hypothetical protein [uncultured Tateyamaria sp.]|nr:hypothetical protein [uncultured Tateyamaria sp.]
MLNIYAHTFMTASRNETRCTRVDDGRKRKWWQPRQTVCINLERL